MSMSREFLEKITEQCEPLFQLNEANVKINHQKRMRLNILVVG